MQQEKRSWSSRFRRLVLWCAALWLLVAAYIVAEIFFNDGFRPSWILNGYALLTVVMSAVSFVLYGLDKRRARRDKHRISERTLHICELLGGWPGALIAQRVFHHKTVKVSFRLVYWLIVCLHVGVCGYAVYRSIGTR